MRALAAALLLWAALLALPTTAGWFPSRVWQYGWVAFDLVLAGALFALSARWRQPLADIVATVVTADAAITLIHAIVYNLPRRDGPLDLFVLVTAVLAPTIAALMLWNARGHRTM